MNFNRINKLNTLVINDIKRKPIIMLEPNKEQSFRFFGSAKDIEIGIDSTEWKITDEIKGYIKDLAKSDYNNEEKILKIYQKLCEDYTYDDNVLSYIKKKDDDTFYLPDDMEEKLIQHGKRIEKSIIEEIALKFQEYLQNQLKRFLRMLIVLIIMIYVLYGMKQLHII